MNANASKTIRKIPTQKKAKLWILGAALLLTVAIALSAKIVIIGSAEDVREKGFSSADFGKENFPKVKSSIEERAVDAKELAIAIMADKTAAGKKYGVGSTMPIIPVKFTGIIEKRAGNYNEIKIEGIDGIVVRVQTGPAINGTDLRDATGTIQFEHFKNQIEFQDAGSALNNEVKEKVLASIDPKSLIGKTVTVTGAFKLINPKTWVITPVGFDVK